MMHRIFLTFLVMIVNLWGEAVTPNGYVLQPGDELEIRSLDVTELNSIVRIRPDGKISLLLLEDISAVGLTATELSRTLTEMYTKHFRNPRIAVMVRNFSSLTAYVGGEVEKPGAVSLTGGLSVSAAIFQAGGVRDSARSAAITVLRTHGEAKPLTLPVNLDAVLKQAEPDIRLQPGDVVFVPKSTVNVYVGGEVAIPGLVPVIGRATVATALIRAGGLRISAKSSDVVLIRQDMAGKPVVTRLNAHAIFERGAADMELQPYDVVFVPKSMIAKADLFIDHYIRQLLPISMNAGFSYITGGGGVFK